MIKLGYISSLNDIVTYGHYTANYSGSDPCTGWVNIIVIPYNGDSDYTIQIVTSLTNDNIYYRKYQAGNWQSWYRIVTSDELTSFQTGVNTIYNGCKTYGSTPSALTPAAIVTAIGNIYTNRYNAGYNAGKTAGKAIYLGTGTSFNVTSYSGYRNFTKNNFIVGIYSIQSSGSTSFSIGLSGGGGVSGSVYCPTITPSYTYSNGVLTCTPTTAAATSNHSSKFTWSDGAKQTITYFAYLIL